MEIPAPDFGASGKNICNVGTSLRKKNSSTQPKQGKQAAKLNSMSKARKTNSRKKVAGEASGMVAKKLTGQTTILDSRLKLKL